MVLPALLVNLRTHHAQAGDTTLSAGSVIGIDFWGEPSFSVDEDGPSIVFTFTPAALNMPSGEFPVTDSLVKSVTVGEQAPTAVIITIERYFPGPWQLDQDLRGPCRYNVYIDPAPLFPLFTDKVVLLDPWIRPHVFSPTNLPEKVPTYDIARRLAHLLAGVQAKPHFSIFSPTFPALSPTAVRNGHPCHAVLSLATLYHPACPRSGFGVLTVPASAPSQRLVNVLKQELQLKLPLPFISEGPTSCRLLREIPAPVAVVQVGCISHRIDEGLLRDIDYKQKVAQGIFNALRRFFSQK
ncbi:MAG TPA: N-acetylmuramoyl-L-alanine amidase [Firmicutes bacterium]|nr:N-acetylmuramoyl-L-alanine amidase [Bacillota bacterium]